MIGNLNIIPFYTITYSGGRDGQPLLRPEGQDDQEDDGYDSFHHHIYMHFIEGVALLLSCGHLH